MASNSKEGYQSTSLTEEQIRQLKCVNRRCKYGHNLVNAFEMVCRYYRINYKPGKLVCSMCLKKCLKHYKVLEKKLLDGECILESRFKNYDLHFVIESSSDDEDDKTELQRFLSNSSSENLSNDQDLYNSIKFAVSSVVDKNERVLKKQYELCDDFVKNRLIDCESSRNEIDNIVTELNNELETIRNSLYDSYKPILHNVGSVDIDHLGNMKVKKRVKDKTNNTFNAKKEDDKLDKEDVIAINSTICAVPADLPKEGPLEYPLLCEGQTVYGMKLSLMQPWFKCKIKSVINNDYVHIKFESDEKLLTTKEIAYFVPSPVQFPVGTRIISKFTDIDTKVTDCFYAGVIAEPPKILNQFRYMIFFDDGYVQYRHHKDIRLVVHKSNQVWNDVHPDFKDFIRSYLEKYPERQMVKLTKKHFVRAAYQNMWQTVKVLEVDASLVKLYFMDLKRSEWLYRGSSRLYNIYEKQSKSQKGIRCRQSGLEYLNKPFVEYTSVEEEPVIATKSVARKSTNNKSSLITPNEEITKYTKYNDNSASNVVILPLPRNIPRPKKFVSHNCNNSCIDWTKYNYKSTMGISMLATPIHFAFNRFLMYFHDNQKCIWYKTPCGRFIRSLKDMHDYLMVTKSTMTIDQFDFNSWVKPLAEFKVVKSLKFVLDISEGKEFRVITCVNNINNKLPPPMEYMTTRRPMPGVNINVDSNFLCGCDCTDNCQDKSKCACWQMTINGQNILPTMDKDPNIGYNYRRLSERVLTGIYECNKTCKCSSSCLNRVVQNPLSQKLQLFLTEKKGWGVRCLNDIPQGSFICIYVGYLLTETDANEGGKNYGDEYLAELDYIEVLEKIKEDYETDVPEESDQDDHDNNKIDETFIISDSSEENQNTAEGINNKNSDIALRLRKRKKPKNETKTKKDDKQAHITSKLNARDMKNNPEAPKSTREYFGNNESVYIMDAKTSGNIGRYLNHSCRPNTFVQNVFVDTHDIRFPWISFFAIHFIPAGTELTWDYSYDIGSVPGKVMKCHCESVYCRKRLL